MCKHFRHHGNLIQRLSPFSWTSWFKISWIIILLSVARSLMWSQQWETHQLNPWSWYILRFLRSTHDNILGISIILTRSDSYHVTTQVSFMDTRLVTWFVGRYKNVILVTKRTCYQQDIFVLSYRFVDLQRNQFNSIWLIFTH